MEYDVFARVFVATGPTINYGARFALSPGNFVSYSSVSGGTILASGVEGYQIREFLLGRVSPTGGEITIFLEDFDGNAFATATVGGLRFESVPEPSSMVLALGGFVAFGVVIRKKQASRLSASGANSTRVKRTLAGLP